MPYKVVKKKIAFCFLTGSVNKMQTRTIRLKNIPLLTYSLLCRYESHSAHISSSSSSVADYSPPACLLTCQRSLSGSVRRSNPSSACSAPCFCPRLVWKSPRHISLHLHPECTAVHRAANPATGLWIIQRGLGQTGAACFISNT